MPTGSIEKLMRDMEKEINRLREVNGVLLEVLKEAIQLGGSSEDEWVPKRTYFKMVNAIAKAEGKE